MKFRVRCNKGPAFGRALFLSGVLALCVTPHAAAKSDPKVDPEWAKITGCSEPSTFAAAFYRAIMVKPLSTRHRSPDGRGLDYKALYADRRSTREQLEVKISSAAPLMDPAGYTGDRFEALWRIAPVYLRKDFNPRDVKSSCESIELGVYDWGLNGLLKERLTFPPVPDPEDRKATSQVILWNVYMIDGSSARWYKTCITLRHTNEAARVDDNDCREIPEALAF